MDAATIEGCNAKLERAEASIEEMARQWREWIDGDAYAPRIDEDRDRREYRLFFDFSKPVAPRFGVRIGEIAHNLRSALDHLVWREAAELLGSEPTDKQAGEIAFPIWTTRVRFKKSKVKRYVSPDAWAIIERHQPYTRGQPKRSQALAMLHWINRVDKHRLLHYGTVSLGFFNPLWLIEFNPHARVLDATIQAPLGQPLKRETEVARYHFAADTPEPDVRVQRAPTTNVSFGDSPRYLRRVELRETVEAVRKVIEDFARLMP